eukprot:765017-Pelagomonas_calceolata.AAC.11
MVRKVTLFLFEFLELRLLSLVTVLACWAAAASRVEKGLVCRAEFKFNKPLPAIVTVARVISRSKRVSIMHASFKFVRKVLCLFGVDGLAVAYHNLEGAARTRRWKKKSTVPTASPPHWKRVLKHPLMQFLPSILHAYSDSSKNSTGNSQDLAAIRKAAMEAAATQKVSKYKVQVEVWNPLL